MKNLLRRAGLAFTSLLLVLTMSPITAAQTMQEIDTCSIKAEDGSCLDLFYSTNDINFYDKDDTCGGSKTIQNPAANLSLDQRIAQTFIVGFDPTATESMSQIVSKYKIGGIFFVGGSDNSKLTKPFFDQLNQSAGIPLFIAADDEGGQVARFTKGVTPSAEAMGQMNTPQIEAEGKKAGDLLVAAGLNGDLAPVLDLRTDGTPWAQTQRNFAADPTNVAAKAGAFAKGLKGAGVTPVYKHFPGIGKVMEHTDKQASTPQTLASIAGDLAPYRELVNKHGGAVMLSNGFITDWDPAIPVSINPQAVAYLRNQLNFTGVIMTDALEVLEKDGYGSKKFTTPDAIARALNAGVDMPLFVLNGGEATIQAAIDKVKADVPADKITVAFNRSLSVRTATQSTVSTSGAGNDSSICCAPSRTGTQVSLNGDNNTEKILNYLMNGMSYKMTLEQASGLVGNFFVEAGGTSNDGSIPESSMVVGPNPSAVSSYGFYGIAQWGGGRWTQLQGFAASNSKPWDDLEIQLRFMAWELGVGETWNGNAGGSEKRSLEAIKNLNEPGTVAVEFEALYERCGCTQEKRRTAALAVYNYYSDKPALPGSGSTTGPSTGGQNTCTGNGPISGNNDIAKTALELAWPNKGQHPGTGKESARETYQIAMPKYNNHTTTMPWTDCGVFTATVIIMSGADPNYPGRGTGVQLPYVRDNFEVIPVDDTSDLVPGLVAVVVGAGGGVGHTYIYTGPYKGDDGKDYDIAEASLGGHIPEADKVYISDYRGPYTFGRPRS